MSVEENKRIVRRFVDALNTEDLDALADLIAADAIDHTPLPGQAPGFEGMKQALRIFTTAFPDLQLGVADLVAEGDRVVLRGTTSGTHRGEFLGIPPTGRRVWVTGTAIIRLAGGKMVERWGITDDVTMMQQLGVIPGPGPAPA